MGNHIFVGERLADLGANHVESLGRARVLDSAHAANEIEGVAIEFAILQVSIIHVD